MDFAQNQIGMKKYIIYIVILTSGFLLGALFFGNSPSAPAIKNSQVVHDHTEDAVQMWTCSMHPQILQPEPGECPICGMDLIPAAADADGVGPDQIKLTKNAMALANVQTTVIGSTGTADGTLRLSGKIEENEENNAVQSAYFSGRIEKLYINFKGEQVRRGQLLATIYAPELVSAQQELLTAASLKESQPQLYRAVRNKLKLWKLSDKQIDAIESEGKVREYFPIYATVSGTVLEKLVNEGDYVQQGEPLLKIANLNTVWAMFDAYEKQLPNLKVGQEIKVTANAYPNKGFDAKISFIEPILTTATRTVMVRAQLNNQDGLLKPGMFVEGQVTAKTSTKEAVLTVPKSAVLWTGLRSVIYVKTDPTEPVFEMREISLGSATNDSYAVISGLQPGEEVVTHGTFTVDAAAQLKGKPSMMNHKGPLEKESILGTTQASAMKMELPQKFQKEFLSVINRYLDLKDALVSSDAEKVKSKAIAMLKEVKEIATKDLGKMEKGHVLKIEDMLHAISENRSIENQRDHFIILSENMVAIANNIDVLDRNLYLIECPMANSNKGAVWLSHSPEVRNPYYGEAMMSCGSVIDTIK